MLINIRKVLLDSRVRFSRTPFNIHNIVILVNTSSLGIKQGNLKNADIPFAGMSLKPFHNKKNLEFPKKRVKYNIKAGGKLRHTFFKGTHSLNGRGLNSSSLILLLFQISEHFIFYFCN